VVTVQSGQEQLRSLLQIAPQQRIAVSHAEQQGPCEASQQRKTAKIQPPGIDEDLSERQRLQSKEAALPAGQREKGQHHPRHNHECIHNMLVAVLRPGIGQTVPRHYQRAQNLGQSVLVVRLRKQFVQSDNIRDAQSRLSEAVPGHLVLPLRKSQPHDERGVLPQPVRRSGPSRLDQVSRRLRGGRRVHRGRRRRG
jgi:hypothetical protein